MQYEPIQPDLSELLSAYLDGEVTADEQMFIERRLHESPAFRQVYDDLRGVQAGLESLPRYSLGCRDLSAEVLRRAEQAMLNTAVNSQVESVAGRAKVMRSRPAARPLLPRYLQWAIPGMAAALVE